MFDKLTVKQLRKLITECRELHNIKGCSKMSKSKLVEELEKRFVIRNDNLYLKAEAVIQPTHAMQQPKVKKRITPTLLSNSVTPSTPMQTTGLTKGQTRMKGVVDKTEQHYSNKNLYNDEDDAYERYAI